MFLCIMMVESNTAKPIRLVNRDLKVCVSKVNRLVELLMLEECGTAYLKWYASYTNVEKRLLNIAHSR